jgi:hypothetical protein
VKRSSAIEQFEMIAQWNASLPLLREPWLTQCPLP